MSTNNRMVNSRATYAMIARLLFLSAVLLGCSATEQQTVFGTSNSVRLLAPLVIPPPPIAPLQPDTASRLMAVTTTISDVDTNLPVTRMSNADGIAVVIGNSRYDRTKPVDFAVRDAASIRRYLTEVLGYREGNILYYENARQSDFSQLFGSAENPRGKLYNMVRAGKSDVFIYYSGHGAPGLADRRAYFVPVDADPHYIHLVGYSLDVFYANLSKLPARTITVVLDACFSGVELFDAISPAGIAVTSPVVLMPHAVVLASSSEQEPSVWHPESRHGMFTYFFLKGIQTGAADADENGKLTLGEIHAYVSDPTDGVPYHARRSRGVEQTPVLIGSAHDRVLVEYGR